MDPSAAGGVEPTRRTPAELKEAYGLRYHVDCLERAEHGGHLAGAKVLEIGGALPADVVLGHYRAASWTAVDNRSAYSSMLGGRPVKARTAVLAPDSPPAADGRHAFFDGDAAHLPATFDTAFDVVMSLATFEHVLDMRAALSQMLNALRPGGVLLSQIGPIWSGWRGHHIFPGHLAPDDDAVTELLRDLVPWQHLLMCPSDMHSWLRSRFGADFTERAVSWFYDSPRLNRLFYRDYLDLFTAVGFSVQSLTINGAPLPAGWGTVLPGLLEKRYPGHTGFEVDSFWVVLRKPGDDGTPVAGSLHDSP